MKREQVIDGQRRRHVLAGAVGLVAIAASGAKAADAPAAFAPAAKPITNRPFVEHRLVLQLSDREAAKQAMVLSVAYNVIKAYGLDQIAIEVVTFGPGIDLLRANSTHRVKVDSLIAQDVRFSVCMNTIETIERETGTPVALNPLASKVQAGVVRIMTLAEEGFTVVRP